MLGDLGAKFSFMGEEVEVSPMEHLPKGNAAVTRNQSTSLSGVLVIDCWLGGHAYFANPFAAFPLSAGFFPEVDEIAIQRIDGEEQFINESNLMFFPRR